MSKYYVYSRELVYYKTVIYANSEAEAEEKFWVVANEDPNRLEACDGSDWELDWIEHIDPSDDYLSDQERPMFYPENNLPF